MRFPITLLLSTLAVTGFGKKPKNVLSAMKRLAALHPNAHTAKYRGVSRCAVLQKHG